MTVIAVASVLTDLLNDRQRKILPASPPVVAGLQQVSRFYLRRLMRATPARQCLVRAAGERVRTQPSIGCFFLPSH